MTGFSEEPRATYSAHMDKAAFLKWNADREGPRCEFKDGELIMHPGVSFKHARVTSALAHVLASKLAADSWVVTSSDFGVEIGDDIRYPDVLVQRHGTDGDAYATATPVVLIEVLSPSSTGRDLRTKVEEYLGLASLEAYIVASQDEPIVWVWQRDASRAFPAEPVEIAGRDREIAVAALSITLPLAEIYRGIGAP